MTIVIARFTLVVGKRGGQRGGTMRQTINKEFISLTDEFACYQKNSVTYEKI